MLIVTESGDLHGAAMAAVLERDHGITPLRVDLRDFPAGSSSFRLGADGVSRTLPGDAVLDGVRSVWWRRPHRCVVPPGLSAEDDEFRQAECDAFVQGLAWSVPALWVNDPGASLVATRKLVQLRAAAGAGLAVPETLVTNDPVAAAEFVGSRPGPVIYKRTGSGPGSFTETRILADLTRLPSIRTSPTTFQDYVDAEADLRIAWVGGRELTVRIDSQAGLGRVDSRLDTTVGFTPYTLPPSVSTALAALMEAMGLAFGVVDMRLGVDGEFWFLEVNPQGQFAYMEIKTGLPIFEALAALLATGEAHHRPASRSGTDRPSGS